MPMQSPPEAKVDPRRYFESVKERRGDYATRQPVCVYLETTNRCNLLCTTCPRTYAELEPPADMSWELFVSIVDQIPNLQRAVLHGVGEPMLVRNLPRMVRYLKDRGTYVLFNTNGTLLNERNGRALIEAGLDELRVSLDASNAKSFRAIRGKDYFARILRNVRAFRNLQEREGADRPRVSAWLTGLKETIAELPAFVEVAAEIGVREVYLQRLVFFDNDAIGLARPDQALYEQVTREEAAYLEAATELARSRHHVCRLRRRVGAGHEPQAAGPRIALDALPATLDRDVLHRKRARAALLHRAVLAAQIRKLHLGRCHPADTAGDLERCGLPLVP
jgi:MoaA/NifB/PqqE/SkfB family radical SAM enzyme